ncbi:unnamed protein product, partial [Mesorhabditis belari]|uniref:Uncharacterized protein n=1 Tax=Mesorhabditis belari TaxID=2138241 RepID=A0AAF3FLH0_9BILA
MSPFLRILALTFVCDTLLFAQDNEKGLLRSKRQTFYYLCGNPPNQYYSTTPCTPNPPRCQNGGRLIGVGCKSSIDCTPFHSGTSQCITGCCCTIPPPTRPPVNQNFGICYHGQLSEVVCSRNNQCASGQLCMNGLCCTATGNAFEHACGGEAALGSCNRFGTCSIGETCVSSNYCCECAVGISPGRCTNSGVCPLGYQCNSNGFCCGSCPGNVMPFGACLNGKCGGGRTCRPGNICCSS